MLTKILLLIECFVLYATLSNLSRAEVEELRWPINKVVKSGEEVILRCQHEKKTVYWTKGNTSNQLNEGGNFINGYTSQYELLETCNTSENRTDLKIKQVTFDTAGTYFCIKDRVNKSLQYGASVVAVEANIICRTIPPFSQNLYVQENERISINCSFTFYSNDQCTADPLWHNVLSNQTISPSENGINIGITNGHMWLSFQGSSQLENGTSFKLSIAFNCSHKSSEIKYARNLPIYISEFESQKFYFSQTENKNDQRIPSPNETKQDGLFGIIFITAAVSAAAAVLIAGLIVKGFKSMKNMASLDADEYLSVDPGNIRPSEYNILQPVTKAAGNETWPIKTSMNENIEEIEDGYDEISVSRDTN